MHGLGFAGALEEIGLPQNAIPLALLFFNVGVEFGQILFVAVVLVSVRLAQLIFVGRLDLRPASAVVAYVVGGLSTFWVVERVASFWT